jgi:RNA polymerase sigma-70 factor (ECF subfamily)
MRTELEPDLLREVVERARTRDPDAWEALYRHCYPRLVSYALRRLPDQSAADDAVSEAMARALRRIDEFSWRGSGFDGWMYGIVRNVVMEQRRRSSRDQRLLDRNSAETNATSDPTSGSPEHVVDAAGDRDLLVRAFERLDDDERELLELRIVGELSAADTGAVLGKNPGAVRTAQMRALGRLRQAMKELGHER